MTDNPEEPPQPQIQIMMTPDQMGGVWANYAMVSHSVHEFTLDFIRLDFSQAPHQGVLVSRINVSPLFITQLMAALETNWQRYAERALPKEAQDDGDDQGS